MPRCREDMLVHAGEQQQVAGLPELISREAVRALEVCLTPRSPPPPRRAAAASLHCVPPCCGLCSLGVPDTMHCSGLFRRSWIMVPRWLPCAASMRTWPTYPPSSGVRLLLGGRMPALWTGEPTSAAVPPLLLLLLLHRQQNEGRSYLVCGHQAGYCPCCCVLWCTVLSSMPRPCLELSVMPTIF